MNTLKTLFAASAMTLAIGNAMAGGLPGVEHNTAQFLTALEGGKPLETMSVADARAVLVGAQADIKLTIVRPAGVKGTLPAFMFFHGGGWVLGDYPTHERLVRDLVAGSGAVAVFVNYTPSPEAHYGVAIKQAYDATACVAAHGKEIHVDGQRLAVAGNSVGGNMAAVVALMAKDKGGPALRFEALLWPVTDANFETASYQQYANDHFLTKGMMQWFWDNYTSDAAQRKEIYAAPLQASVAQLRGLPPTLIETAEFDVLRDEGEAYGHKPNAAGVDVTSVRYGGMIHDFGLLNVVSQVPAVRAAMAQAAQQLKDHLK